MKKKSDGQFAFFYLRVLIALLVFLGGVGLAMLTFAQARGAKPAASIPQRPKPASRAPDQGFWAQTNGPQGGDGIALATNASGDVFVGTQGGGIFSLRMTAKRGQVSIMD
jgi:hypothetical protein